MWYHHINYIRVTKDNIEKLAELIGGRIGLSVDIFDDTDLVDKKNVVPYIVVPSRVGIHYIRCGDTLGYDLNHRSIVYNIGVDIDDVKDFEWLVNKDRDQWEDKNVLKKTRKPKK